MSTFFYSIFDFLTSTPFVLFWAVPIPFYAIALMYRAFCFRGGRND